MPPVLEYSNGLYPQYAGCLDYVNKDDCVLNVPVGSLEAYKSADGWKRFKNIQEKDFGGVERDLWRIRKMVVPSLRSSAVSCLLSRYCGEYGNPSSQSKGVSDIKQWVAVSRKHLAFFFYQT